MDTISQESLKSNNSHANMRKVAFTALAGTSIEWYDFFLYGAAAALVFPTVFFGEMSSSSALILSLLTFAAGFIARPIGGIIFGHFGDRVGRNFLALSPAFYRPRPAPRQRCSCHRR